MSSYYFNVPLTQWDLYCKHIIEGIYGVKEGGYRITRDHNNMRRIELTVNPQIPLINSMPVTIKKTPETAVYYIGNILEDVAISIQNAVRNYIEPGSTFHINPKKIPIHDLELRPLIYQLALDERITKFSLLTNNQFIVYIEPYPVVVLIKILNNYLCVNIYSETIQSTFDVDDGYFGHLSCLNPFWIQWKEAADLTAPIQPPNYI